MPVPLTCRLPVLLTVNALPVAELVNVPELLNVPEFSVKLNAGHSSGTSRMRCASMPKRLAMSSVS